MIIGALLGWIIAMVIVNVMTHNAINNAFDIQKMVDPTFQRFI